MGSLREKIIWAALERLYRIYAGLSMSLLSRINFGTNIYERDWDVLIVLDTARVDAMRDVAGEFEFLETIESVRSLGSTSSEWIAKTFDRTYEEQISDTVLVSANPHTQYTLFDRKFPEHDKNAPFAFTSWNTVTPDTFAHIDQPWKYATNHEYKHVLPADMTQRAVALHREHEPERMIVHFMQPHRPHFAKAILEDRDLTAAEKDPFQYLKTGGDRELVYSNHVADLKFVLETGVEPLLRNVDAETVVITADHGDGFGEYWCYAHIAGDPRPQVRRVPWVVTDARNTGELQPTLEPPDSIEDRTEEHLEALGYL